MMKTSQYLSRIYVNGIQIGDNNTFSDYFTSDTEAIDSTREFMQSEYSKSNVAVMLQLLPNYPNAPAVKTLVINITKQQ